MIQEIFFDFVMMAQKLVLIIIYNEIISWEVALEIYGKDKSLLEEGDPENFCPTWY